MSMRALRSLLGIGSVSVILAGCGAVSSGTSAVPQVATTGTSQVQRTSEKSWMLPEAQGEDLLYASSGYFVGVFGYPGMKRVGSLAGFSNSDGICVDSASNVWIVDKYPAAVSEYAHGGTKPLQTIKWSHAGTPVGCAVDPTTGNLAIMGNTFLAIYSNEQGPPTIYWLGSGWDGLVYGTYDNAGNLFAIGYYAVQSKWRAELAELPRGGNSIDPILFNEEITPTTAQWNGENLVVGGGASRGEPIGLYQISVSGSEAAITSTTVLKRPQDRYGQWGQFALQGNRVIEGMNAQRGLGLWRYPQGGAPLTNVTSVDVGIAGVAVSSAPADRKR
jgi:hypothetical protein